MPAAIWAGGVGEGLQTDARSARTRLNRETSQCQHPVTLSLGTAAFLPGEGGWAWLLPPGSQEELRVQSS